MASRRNHPYEIGDPLQSVLDEVAAYFVAMGLFKIDGLAPRRLVHMGEVKCRTGMVIPFRAHVVINHVQHHRDPCAGKYRRAALVPPGHRRSSAPRKVDTVVPPVTVCRELGDGHDSIAVIPSALSGDPGDGCIESSFRCKRADVKLIHNVFVQGKAPPARITPVKIATHHLARPVYALRLRESETGSGSRFRRSTGSDRAPPVRAINSAKKYPRSRTSMESRAPAGLSHELLLVPREAPKPKTGICHAQTRSPRAVPHMPISPEVQTFNRSNWAVTAPEAENARQRNATHSGRLLSSYPTSYTAFSSRWTSIRRRVLRVDGRRNLRTPGLEIGLQETETHRRIPRLGPSAIGCSSFAASHRPLASQTIWKTPHNETIEACPRHPATANA